jgi:hypothetical protein
LPSNEEKAGLKLGSTGGNKDPDELGHWVRTGVPVGPRTHTEYAVTSRHMDTHRDIGQPDHTGLTCFESVSRHSIVSNCFAEQPCLPPVLTLQNRHFFHEKLKTVKPWKIPGRHDANGNHVMDYAGHKATLVCVAGYSARL